MRVVLLILMMADVAIGQRFGGITSIQNNFADAALDNYWAYRGISSGTSTTGFVRVPSPAPGPPPPGYTVHGTQGVGERWNVHGTEGHCDSVWCK